MTESIQAAIDDLQEQRERLELKIDYIDDAIEQLRGVAEQLDNDGAPPKARAPRAAAARKAKAAPKPRAAAKPRAAKAKPPKASTNGDKPSAAKVLAERKRVLAPALKHAPGTPERIAALKALAEKPFEYCGELKTIGYTGLYGWVQQIEG